MTNDTQSSRRIRCNRRRGAGSSSEGTGSEKQSQRRNVDGIKRAGEGTVLCAEVPLLRDSPRQCLLTKLERFSPECTSPEDARKQQVVPRRIEVSFKPEAREALLATVLSSKCTVSDPPDDIVQRFTRGSTLIQTQEILTHAAKLSDQPGLPICLQKNNFVKQIAEENLVLPVRKRSNAEELSSAFTSSSSRERPTTKAQSTTDASPFHALKGKSVYKTQYFAVDEMKVSSLDQSIGTRVVDGDAIKPSQLFRSESTLERSDDSDGTLCPPTMSDIHSPRITLCRIVAQGENVRSLAGYDSERDDQRYTERTSFPFSVSEAPSADTGMPGNDTHLTSRMDQYPQQNANSIRNKSSCSENQQKHIPSAGINEVLRSFAAEIQKVQDLIDSTADSKRRDSSEQSEISSEFPNDQIMSSISSEISGVRLKERMQRSTTAEIEALIGMEALAASQLRVLAEQLGVDVPSGCSSPEWVSNSAKQSKERQLGLRTSREPPNQSKFAVQAEASEIASYSSADTCALQQLPTDQLERLRSQSFSEEEVSSPIITPSRNSFSPSACNCRDTWSNRFSKSGVLKANSSNMEPHEPPISPCMETPRFPSSAVTSSTLGDRCAKVPKDVNSRNSVTSNDPRRLPVNTNLSRNLSDLTEDNQEQLDLGANQLDGRLKLEKGDKLRKESNQNNAAFCRIPSKLPPRLASIFHELCDVASLSEETCIRSQTDRHCDGHATCKSQMRVISPASSKGITVPAKHPLLIHSNFSENRNINLTSQSLSKEASSSVTSSSGAIVPFISLSQMSTATSFHPNSSSLITSHATVGSQVSSGTHKNPAKVTPVDKATFANSVALRLPSPRTLQRNVPKLERPPSNSPLTIQIPPGQSEAVQDGSTNSTFVNAAARDYKVRAIPFTMGGSRIFPRADVAAVRTPVISTPARSAARGTAISVSTSNLTISNNQNIKDLATPMTVSNPPVSPQPCFAARPYYVSSNAIPQFIRDVRPPINHLNPQNIKDKLSPKKVSGEQTSSSPAYPLLTSKNNASLARFNRHYGAAGSTMQYPAQVPAAQDRFKVDAAAWVIQNGRQARVPEPLSTNTSYIFCQNQSNSAPIRGGTPVLNLSSETAFPIMVTECVRRDRGTERKSDAARAVSGERESRFTARIVPVRSFSTLDDQPRSFGDPVQVGGVPAQMTIHGRNWHSDKRNSKESFPVTATVRGAEFCRVCSRSQMKASMSQPKPRKRSKARGFVRKRRITRRGFSKISERNKLRLRISEAQDYDCTCRVPEQNSRHFQRYYEDCPSLPLTSRYNGYSQMFDDSSFSESDSIDSPADYWSNPRDMPRRSLCVFKQCKSFGRCFSHSRLRKARFGRSCETVPLSARPIVVPVAAHIITR